MGILNGLSAISDTNNRARVSGEEDRT
jgi:hypothetical protein